MQPSWLRSQADGSDGPEGLADQVKALIHPQPPEVATFADVNADVRDPFRQAEQGDARDHGHQEGVNPAMGSQPPLPAEDLAASRTLLPSHPVALQAEIADEMTHRQQQEEVEASGEVQQLKPREAVHTLEDC